MPDNEDQLECVGAKTQLKDPKKVDVKYKVDVGASSAAASCKVP